MSKKPDFNKLRTVKKPAKVGGVEKGNFMAVRLAKKDFLRAKFAFAEHDLSIQSGLVEAINRLMIEWGESPVADIGTSRKNN